MEGKSRREAENKACIHASVQPACSSFYSPGSPGHGMVPPIIIGIPTQLNNPSQVFLEVSFNLHTLSQVCPWGITENCEERAEEECLARDLKV